MKILALECSAAPVSAAVIEEGNILSFAFSNIKLTHSQTLFPIIKNALDTARLKFGDIDAVSAATGPGSFTGLRIGISSAKGLAEPRGLKCAGVSTLLAAAYMFTGADVIVCPVIDARCDQVYSAFFRVSGSAVTRITDDRALMIDELKSELISLSKTADKRIILCGDAANAVMAVAEGIQGMRIAPAPLRDITAVGVGLCAEEMIKKGDYTGPAGLKPVYLKLPQAERELKAKQGKDLKI